MRNSCRQSGQAVVLITLSSLLVFATLGLTVDVGFAYYRHQAQRAAAESAAKAAALAANTGLGSGSSFRCNSTYAVCQSSTACPSSLSSPASTDIVSGCLYAQANGYTAGGDGGRQNVLMAAGTGAPPGVTGLSANYWVIATVSDSIPQLFSAVFPSNRSLNPSVSATAAVILGSAGGCIYALAPTASNAFVASGGQTVVQASCGVHVNSTSSQALVVSGGATLTTTPSPIDVVGNYTANSSTVTPTPTTGVTAAANPFASVPTPTINTPVTCTATNYTLHGGSATIGPGTYCGGITNQGGTLTFTTGLYILYGGGLTSSSTSGNLIGNGVTFYNTQGSGYAYKPITISGGGSTSLSPMTTGPQAGILFFEDPTITSSSKNAISGGSSTSFTGGMYFKNDELVYSGGSAQTPNAVLIVVNTIEFSGASTLTAYGGGVGGQQTVVALVQ